MNLEAIDTKAEEKKRTQLEDQNRGDVGGAGKPVDDIGHAKPNGDGSPKGPMEGNLMSFNKMLENLNEISDNLENVGNITNFEDTPIGDSEPKMGLGSMNEEDLLNELNQIFTPILVVQGIEGDISDQIKEACSQDNLLMENNVIKFDDSSRMAQLTSVCALLIARQKNTPQWNMYKKASELRKSMKLDIQKSEYAASKALAQKFLVKVSTTNNSSIARQSANDLLPETQH